MANGISIPVPQVTTLGQAISGGLQQAQNIEKTKQALQTARAQLPLIQAETQLKQAQAQAQTQQALGGQQFKPGTLGAVTTARLYAKHMKDTFGANSPQYLNALQDLDLTKHQVEATIQREEALTSFLPLRGLTTAGRSAVEEANTRAGFSPTGETWQQQVGLGSRILNDPLGRTLIKDAPLGQPGQLPTITQPPRAQPTVKTKFGELPASPAGIPPGSTDLANQFALNRIKSTTDNDTRQRLRFATNVDKTFQFLNKLAPNALSYSHPGGLADLAQDKLEAAHGNTPQRYQDYVNFNKSLEFLKEQMIQFYNLSKQPSKSKEISKLLNSISFLSNPTQAINTLKQIEKIYNVERQTFLKAANDPDIYKNKGIDLSKDLDQQLKSAKATQSDDLSAARNMSTADLMRIAQGGQ